MKLLLGIIVVTYSTVAFLITDSRRNHVGFKCGQIISPTLLLSFIAQPGLVYGDR